jgi:alkylhydroperoxidase/carboxymuconolactone decarboxylase family protein YurZ
MKEFNPELFATCANWRDAITHDKTIPLRQKEMMMVAMACLIRFESGVRTHARYALAEGVTKDELYACATLAMLLGGVPAYRDGILWIKDELEKQGAA